MVGIHSCTVDAAAYADYLRTVEGRLRVNLAWENLRAFLPPKAQGRALDVGCGTGEMVVRLAQSGMRVTALDSSDTMLAETQRGVAKAGLQKDVSVVCSHAAKLRNLFSPASFDVIVCHNLLEFVDHPSEILQAIEVLLAQSRGAVASVIVRNRAGEVLSAAVKSGDLAAAEANLTAPKVRAKLTDGMVAVFTPAELRSMMSDARLEVIAEYGVRVFSDYLPQGFVNDPANYPLLLALEQKLGNQPNFAAIARYTQVIVRPSGVPGAPLEGRRP
jgi:2-polyprenyl-3-methyl-5-hydroxy-6-metoxy-1,4-benzoquinol methylase